jgi:TRAP-type mannitol/chloroaromatic compound transport system permease small subunit
MEKFAKTVEAISEHLGRWVSWIIYVGIIMLSAEVVLRYIFNSPTVWAHGYTQRLFGGYFILIGAYTLVHKGHVRVDVIYEHVSEKAKAYLDLLNYAFLLLWSGVMIPVSWNFFLKSYEISEVDEMVLAHPIWWVKFLIIIGMTLIFLQGLNEAIKVILKLSSHKQTNTAIEGREA